MADDVGVLIVDDSSLVRKALTAALEKQPGIRVVATAPDPYIARDKILELSPDVLILDLQMPRMDGLTFLKKLKKYHPVPTIILSAITESGTETALECLKHGAIEVFQKPTGDRPLASVASEIAAVIRGIRSVRSGIDVNQAAPTLSGPSASQDLAAINNSALDPHRVIVIGSSTGGTEALRQVLTPLSSITPGIVMAQHMPPGFTTAFAGRLNGLSKIEVREAADGDRVLPGLALLAPGERHVKLVRDASGYRVRVTDGPRVCRHKPSVEVLFQSAAAEARSNALGIMLTGMGDDGADGLVAMRQAGAQTIGQDEASCVVYGMPKAAFDRGGVEKQLPLTEIPNAIAAFSRASMKSKAA
ncbi:MAG: chemotaxis response regulator protein-glutamate methylesterase [Phycisphaeraceae bacterium]|nr:chemotaxis response regulator protein-glutamate methylesterase [Phycisphaerales bacterium]MCB9841631.1 chemotaxis response regulator protein-glutamate methylesterase [Phycisphaeraceae bacterium]